MGWKHYANAVIQESVLITIHYAPNVENFGLIHVNLSLKEHWKYANNASKTAFVLATINTLIIGACSLFWVDLSRYCDIYIN